MPTTLGSITNTGNLKLNTVESYEINDFSQGQVLWNVPGSYFWIVPPSITTVSAVCIGAGGSSAGADSGGYSSSGGGGGGGLAWGNINVTPGEQLFVVVGSGGTATTVATVTSITQGQFGGNSYIQRANAQIVLQGGGGGPGISANIVLSPGGFGGISSGTNRTNGGVGGNGGTVTGDNQSGAGGGGAGGYFGIGGQGGNVAVNTGVAGGNPATNSGGGGGGGSGGSGSGTGNIGGAAGGGVGIFGAGADGTGGPGITVGGSNSGGGTGGSGGTNGANVTIRGGYGGNFGGGGGGFPDDAGISPAPCNGGNGGVRIVWGPNRWYPNVANVANVTTMYTNPPLNSVNVSAFYSSEFNEMAALPADTVQRIKGNIWYINGELVEI